MSLEPPKPSKLLELAARGAPLSSSGCTHASSWWGSCGFLVLERFQAEPWGLLFVSCRQAHVPMSRLTGWPGGWFINRVQ